jgi:hypothetical protein
MGDKFGHFVFGDTDVMVIDESAAGAGGEDMLVPAHDANARVMAMHAPELATFFDIPNLNFARAKPNAHVGTISAPFHAAHVSIIRRLEEAADSASLGRPHVNIPLEPNRNLIPGTPIQKIEVVIIHQTRGVKDAFRGGQYPSPKLSRD